MGLLDYYRQFEDVDQEEWNRGLRERRAREKAMALQRVVQVDLSGTEWPDMPNSEVVNAAIARARGWVNGYPDRHAAAIRSLLAERHGVAAEQIVVGNGAAELLQAATFALLTPGEELVMPWPSYPLYPLMASRAGARPIADELDNVTVFRTFSKVYGISGLRCGYAVGSTGATRLLDAIAPALGVNALTQAAVEYALRFGEDEIGRRCELVIEQRRRIERALPELPVDAPESQANFIWLHATGLTGAQLAAHFQNEGVTVAPGGPLGADDHVRPAIRGAAATDRLLTALSNLSK